MGDVSYGLAERRAAKARRATPIQALIVLPALYAAAGLMCAYLAASFILAWTEALFPRRD